MEDSWLETGQTAVAEPEQLHSFEFAVVVFEESPQTVVVVVVEVLLQKTSSAILPILQTVAAEVAV